MKFIRNQGRWSTEGIVQLPASLFVPGTRVEVVERTVKFSNTPTDPDEGTPSGPGFEETPYVFLLCKRQVWGRVSSEGGTVEAAGPVLNLDLQDGSEFRILPYDGTSQIFSPGQTYKGDWPALKDQDAPRG